MAVTDSTTPLVVPRHRRKRQGLNGRPGCGTVMTVTPPAVPSPRTAILRIFRVDVLATYRNFWSRSNASPFAPNANSGAGSNCGSLLHTALLEPSGATLVIVPANESDTYRLRWRS